jgi:signal transduction histidine kinase/DNA-binding NarL/FixJ family response regulator
VSDHSPAAERAVTVFMASSGRFGVALVDESGIVVERFGALVEHVPAGTPAEDAFPLLLGFEEELDAIRSEGEGHLHLPNMNLVLEDGRAVFASVFLTPGADSGSLAVVLQDTTEASETHRKMMQQRNDLDIARRQLEHANEQLEEARARAEEATQAKSRFLAMMTHEIRTPMNGVLGMLQLIDDGTLDMEKRGYALTARTSAEALLQIIGDILDFSKIEAGRLDIERIPFSVAEVVEGVVTLLRPKADEKGIALDLYLGDALPRAVVGDPVRCRQVLLNLLGNAIKFTSRGGVTLSVQTEPGDAGILHFAVADTGIGIPAEAQGRLFQEFTQTDASTTRRFGGTGLGLAICKRLVTLMDGSIGLESVEGRGSTFWFRLPMEPTDVVVAEPDPSDLPAPVTGARILLADDALANRQVAVAMLGKAGYMVDTAVDGHDAVEKVGTGGYDLVLMDVNMPGMGGHEATVTLREHGVTIPVLAMTAHPESEVEGREDFDGYIGKPVRRADLLHRVATVLRDAGIAQREASHGVSETEPNRPVRTPPDLPQDDSIDLPEDDSADQPDGTWAEVVDRDTLSGFLDDVGAEVFPTLVDTYLTEIRKRVDTLAETLASGALDVVERHAHDIKSCAATVGVRALRDHAARLENAAREGDGHTVAEEVPRVVRAAEVAYPAVESGRDALLG